MPAVNPAASPNGVISDTNFEFIFISINECAQGQMPKAQSRLFRLCECATHLSAQR